MTSNMLAGERRWASSRRGGMTVLGKVAVPKPLNLPSQRLENHGLDPSVEIVPKGTLSWGSRPSSSGSNAWNSSSLPSNADGGNTSPSHLGGRPSSSGTGTRPSTAGSDKTHEPIAVAWGPNSRPSSASGTLASNQSSSTSLRPRSAETRPNSSQLSRFAEPISESSVAWAPSSIAERLGVKSSKEDGFSLSSGDFPTLGSEKDNNVKNFESQSDNGRPISASSRTTSPKEDNTNLADAKRGMVNSWRADGPQTAGDGIRPSMDNWQGERQQYFNANGAPQHFDSWRGPPFNGSASVWYGGPPQGPPFRAPGGFPMEPFPFYRPQVPPPALGGSQQAPPPGSGPRGPHPQHGDLYRPQMHDSYAGPGAPFRPGFYAGPPGPMSYYGTPMGYCNNERDIQYMGMAAGPPVHGGYPGQSAPDIVTSHVRAGERDISGKTMPEDIKSDHLEALGSRKAPLKNYGEWGRKEDRENWEHDVPNVLHPGNSRLPMIKSRKTEWGAENDTEEDMFANNKTPSGNYSHHSHSFPYRDHSSDSVKVKSFESMGNVKRDDDSWTNKANSVATYPPGMPQLPLASEGDELLRPATNDSALMQKIEGLNAKVRASDGRNDVPNVYNTEEQRSRSQHVDLKNNNNTGPGEISNTAGFSEKAPGFGDFVPLPQGGVGDVSDKSIQPVAVVSRRSYHGGQVRVDHRGKGKFNNQDTDGWQRKLLTHDSSSAVASNIESESGIHVHGPSFAGEATDNSVTNPVGKIEGESVAETFDSTDIQAKRAKRELAKQRALKLQREEEERIKEQKAKALAKLEELNRRTQAVEVANPVAGKIQAISDIQGEQEEFLTIGDPVTDHPRFEAPCTNLVSEPGNAYMVRESSTIKAGKSVAQVSRNLPQDMSETGLLESDVSDGHHMPIKEDTQTVNARNTPSQRKQNNLSQKSSNAKSVPISVSARQNDSHAAAVDITGTEAPSSEIKPSGESNVHKTSNTVAAPQRKKVNKSTKNKHKTEAALSLPAVISDPNHEKKLSENSESKATSSNLDSSISKVIEPEGSQGHQASSLPKEESQSGVTNHRRPQPVRRMPRNQQGNRHMDKAHGSEVVWAPVRAQIKPEDSFDASQKSTLESANPTKIDVAQNSFRGKRAEMERYVPKPVAKELAQQGSISSSILDEAPVIGQLGSYVEIKEADGRHNKHKKEPGQWRQRGKTYSSHTRPSPISEANKNIQQSMEQGGLEKSEKYPEIKDSHVGNTSGYNNWSNDTTPAAVSISDTRKDHGAAGRGKRHMTRRPRSSTGNSDDHDNIPSGQIDETSSQWKPKSRPNSANNQHGNKIAGSETLTTEINKLPKNDLPQYKAPQLVFGSIVADDSIVSHHLELNQEKNERNISGSGRNSQNSRFTRGYESRGERYSGQDNRMRNVPALHERQRQNVQYEYHPVRHGKSGVPETFDGPAADGANNMDQRYRERGQSHPRHGENHYRRQGGSVGQEY